MLAKKAKGFPQIENDHGLLVVVGSRTLLNYLWEADGHGIYEPNYGRCPPSITSEMAKQHNKLLDEALIKGLDENCEVGQCGTFYVGRNEKGDLQVRTFLGTIVAPNVSVRSKLIYQFVRGGKEFQGRLSRNSDMTTVTRIS